MKQLNSNTVELTPGEIVAKEDYEAMLDRGMHQVDALIVTMNLNPTVFEFPTNQAFANYLAA